LKKKLAAEHECYTPNVLKNMALETQKAIYGSMKIDELKMMNMGGPEGNKDPAG